MDPQEKNRIPSEESASGVNRRQFVNAVVAGGLTAGVLPLDASARAMPEGSMATTQCTLTINDQVHSLDLDPRVTLLDLVREHLEMPGTKKGCDHGQCGACTVLVNGRRINSCLSLAVMHDGDHITTIEGLEQNGELHPMQAAFIEHDGFQCGYCTPGQICSAIAMLNEAGRGEPSFVTPELAKMRPLDLTDDEIRERMSGNLCRCAAYPNIIAAVRAVHSSRPGQNA